MAKPLILITLDVDSDNTRRSDRITPRKPHKIQEDIIWDDGDTEADARVDPRRSGRSARHQW